MEHHPAKIFTEKNQTMENLAGGHGSTERPLLKPSREVLLLLVPTKDLDTDRWSGT